MRAAVLGALAGAGLVLAASVGLNPAAEVFAQRLPAYQAGGPSGELIVVPLAGGEKDQVLAVIDSRQRVLGVYQIDPSNGKITLLSARNLQWDLQMTEFNTGNPLPREIRALLEQR